MPSGAGGGPGPASLGGGVELGSGLDDAARGPCGLGVGRKRNAAGVEPEVALDAGAHEPAAFRDVADADIEFAQQPGARAGRIEQPHDGLVIGPAAAGPSSTATLPPSTVIVTVRSGGRSQSRSVQTASAMARFCVSSQGCIGADGPAAWGTGAARGTWSVTGFMGGVSCG